LLHTIVRLDKLIYYTSFHTDDESEDELVAPEGGDDNHVYLGENEESETPAPDIRGKDDTEEEEDPYSSMFETQQWPYDPNAGSGIYY